MIGLRWLAVYRGLGPLSNSVENSLDVVGAPLASVLKPLRLKPRILTVFSDLDIRSQRGFYLAALMVWQYIRLAYADKLRGAGRHASTSTRTICMYLI